MTHWITAFRVVAVVLLGTVWLTAKAEAPEGYPFLTYDEGLRQAQVSGKKVFVYFGRPGCGFCETTNKQAFSSGPVKLAYREHYILVYVNSESGKRLTLSNGERITEMQLGERMNTFGTPVFLFLEPSGQLIVKRFGVQSAETFLLLDRFVNQGHYRSLSFSQFEKQVP